MLVLVTKDVLLYNSVNIAMINANIKIVWQGSKSLFKSFFIILLNLKNLKLDIKYKKKPTKSIAYYIYNYIIYKL